MSIAETNFSAALATWKEINLTELQKNLDAQGIELVDNQKESLVGRKNLAEKTKDFKKLPDDEKGNAFKGLLKAYQTEIDNLTKRSKISDNAFLHAYKLLAEAPDPYPLLEVAVDQTVKVAEAMEQDVELQRLRDENAELKKRVVDFSIVENAKKKLELKVEQLEQKMDTMIHDKVSQKANELTATYDEKFRNYEDREQDSLRQLTVTKMQLRDLRISNDSNQEKLLDHTQKQDEAVAAKLAEVDMIVADLDRANSRVVALEHRNEILRAEIETMRGGSESSERVKALESQIAEVEGEMEALSHSLEGQKIRTSEVSATGQRKADELSKDLQKRSIEVDQLRSKLRQFDDYDEIKRELEVMKYVEFSGFDENDEEDSGVERVLLSLPDPNARKTVGRKGKSLETLLAIKNKRLQEQLTKLRILYGELEGHLRTSQEKLDQATTELHGQKELNEKLELDLLTMNKNSSDVPTTDNDSDVLASLSVEETSDGPVRTAPIPFTPSAETSILPIVTSQRDRFRQRNAELEEELRKQFRIISELRSEIKTLQNDNLKLYEKVRYMQSYWEDSGNRPVTQLDPLPPPSALPDGLIKYQTKYEETMNPFEVFRGREATRAYQALNPVERGVLALTRLILGNRRARALFICYAFVLHVMVLYTTYGCTSSSTQLQTQPNPYSS